MKSIIYPEKELSPFLRLEFLKDISIHFKDKLFRATINYFLTTIQRSGDFLQRKSFPILLDVNHGYKILPMMRVLVSHKVDVDSDYYFSTARILKIMHIRKFQVQRWTIDTEAAHLDRRRQVITGNRIGIGTGEQNGKSQNETERFDGAKIHDCC